MVFGFRLGRVGVSHQELEPGEARIAAVAGGVVGQREDPSPTRRGDV